MPKPLTIGQINKLKQNLNKGNFKKLVGKRLVTALRQWVLHNKKQGALVVFPVQSDQDLRDHIVNVAEWVGCDPSHSDFQAALQGVKAAIENQYRQINGSHGHVPADVVQQICDKYKMQRAVIEAACNTFAPAQGGNGIKQLNAGAKYIAELKLLPMGGERVYASKKTNNRFQFDTIAKHL